MSRSWRFIVVCLLSCVTRRVKTKPVVVALVLLMAGCATMPPPPYRAPSSPVWGYRGTDMKDLPLVTYAPTRSVPDAPGVRGNRERPGPRSET